jgi:phosphoenolpyruvate synthase/pyruvate phosphate dikinase
LSRRKLPGAAGTFTINDEEAGEIVKIGKALEAHFGTPQDLSGL